MGMQMQCRAAGWFTSLSLQSKERERNGWGRQSCSTEETPLEGMLELILFVSAMVFPGQEADVATASLLWCEPTTDCALQSPGRWCLKRKCDKLCHWIEAVKRSHGQKRGLGMPIPLNTPARFSQSAKKLGKLGHLLQLGSTTSSTPAAGCLPPVPTALVPQIPQPGNPSCKFLTRTKRVASKTSLSHLKIR